MRYFTVEDAEGVLVAYEVTPSNETDAWCAVLADSLRLGLGPDAVHVRMGA